MTEQSATTTIDDDFLELDRGETLRLMDRSIEGKQAEVADLEAKREYFLANFRAYFPTVGVEKEGA